jgi:hypothetical protein
MTVSDTLTRLQEWALEHGVEITGFKISEDKAKQLAAEVDTGFLGSGGLKPGLVGEFLGVRLYVQDPRPILLANAQRALTAAQAALTKLHDAEQA